MEPSLTTRWTPQRSDWNVASQSQGTGLQSHQLFFRKFHVWFFGPNGEPECLMLLLLLKFRFFKCDDEESIKRVKSKRQTILWCMWTWQGCGREVVNNRRTGRCLYRTGSCLYRTGRCLYRTGRCWYPEPNSECKSVTSEPHTSGGVVLMCVH